MIVFVLLKVNECTKQFLERSELRINLKSVELRELRLLLLDSSATMTPRGQFGGCVTWTVASKFAKADSLYKCAELRTVRLLCLSLQHLRPRGGQLGGCVQDAPFCWSCCRRTVDQTSSQADVPVPGANLPTRGNERHASA